MNEHAKPKEDELESYWEQAVRDLVKHKDPEWVIELLLMRHQPPPLARKAPEAVERKAREIGLTGFLS